MITMKMARAKSDLTQQEVADAMGVHVQTYASMEKNPGSMSIDDGKRFAEITGFSFEDIFFDTDSN